MILKSLTYKGYIVFQKLRVASFKRLPKEYHENEACFIFVNEGKLKVRAQTEILEVHESSGLLAKCLNYFYETDMYKTSQKKAELEVVGVMLYPGLVRDLFEFDISSSNYQFDFNLKQVEVNQLLEHFRESINILLDNPVLADDQLVKNKLREFVLLMTKTMRAPSELDFLSAMFKPNFVHFEEVIQRNIYSDLNLHELASLCHMSLSTFKRKFREVYKESPVKYLTKMKINRAQMLLKDRDLHVSDIAYELGYSSLTTFNRAFKAQTGKSPTEYRLSQIQ